MNNKGQSALEYLMTYGWALIVVAVIIGILIYVTSSAAGGVTCASSNSQIVMKQWVFGTGADKVGFTLQNATGSAITFGADCVTAASGDISEGVTVSACATSPTAANAAFTVQQLDGPASSTTVSGATATVTYTVSGLTGTAIVTCNGKI
ncbi:MAG: hypothetical protein AABW72_02995 [archaeon]